MNLFFENVLASLNDFVTTLGQNVDDILFALIKIACIIIAACIVSAILNRLSKKIIKNRARRNPQASTSQKAETLQTVTNSAIKYAISFLALMAILGVLGLSAAVGSLITVAGIGGIIIAFGAQSLVKDVFSGLFLLFENQYAIGDYIEADGEKGTVAAVTLRTTSINKFSGEVAIIPNGSITKVINYSKRDHLAVIDMPISYDTDIEEAGQIMLSVGLEYMAKHDNILEEPHILGVIEMGESKIVLRMIMRVQPLTHWVAERALRQAVLEEFARRHVAVPYPRQVVING